ncbi:MAG: hypothetical protein ABEJ60_06200 [Halodesulfurarchaeum sp.]
MDEILEAVDVIADFGLEGVLRWFLRLIGLVVFLLGLGLWVFTDMGLLLVPGVLVVGGMILLIVPGILLSLVEFVA